MSRKSLQSTRLQYGSDLLLEAGEVAILYALVRVEKGWVTNMDLQSIYYNAEREAKVGDFERTMKTLQRYLFNRKIFICKGFCDYWMIKIYADDPQIVAKLQDWELI